MWLTAREWTASSSTESLHVLTSGSGFLRKKGSLLQDLQFKTDRAIAGVKKVSLRFLHSFELIGIQFIVVSLLHILRKNSLEAMYIQLS